MVTLIQRDPEADRQGVLNGSGVAVSEGKLARRRNVGDVWWEVVTPERAAELLTCNCANRNLSERTLRNYVQQMTDGLWLKTGQTIGLLPDGTLIDGQHRLTAVVKSGTTHEFLFCVEEQTQVVRVIDSGKKRSFADTLKMEGYERAGQLSATVRYYAFLRDLEARDGSRGDWPQQRLWMILLDVDNATWDEASKIAGRSSLRQLRLAPHLAACFVAFCQNGDQCAAATFCSKVESGLDLTEGSPIYALRKSMDVSLSSRSTSRLRPRAVFMRIVRSWNAWCLGEDLRQIKVAGLAFPKIERAS